MAVYVTARHMAGGAGHEAIAGVRWVDRETKETGESTCAAMVARIEGGEDVRVADGFYYAQVRVVDATPKYLRTYADGIWTDHLLALPALRK